MEVIIFINEHDFSLNCVAKTTRDLGTSVDGNITRLNNAFEKIHEKLNDIE